ncbi:MAG: hypothetical protein II937_09975 [Bacteroidales bacterium]|nr:hypothetical protein [Bacteroidales bacterium]
MKDQTFKNIMKAINITIIALCIVAVVVFGYCLIVAECSYFNYIYLLGIAIAAMIAGETFLKTR